MRLIGVLVLLATHAAATPYMHPEKARLLVEAQEAMAAEQFGVADSLEQQLVSLFPGDPARWLIRAGRMMSEMSAAEEQLYSAEFHQALDSLEQSARARLALAPDSTTSSWMYLYIGHSKAWRAVYQSKFGSTLSAIRNGMAANGAYKEGLALDSTNVDHYLGLGTFRYWRTVKGGVLRWIGLIPNERREGIQMHRVAAASSTISRQAALTSLLWVWLHEKEYDSVVTLASELRDRYPQVGALLWPLGAALAGAEQWEAAAAVFDTLRQRYAPRPGNYFNLIECDYQIAHAANAAGNRAKAELCARMVMGYLDLVPERTRERQKRKLEELRSLTQSTLASDQ